MLWKIACCEQDKRDKCVFFHSVRSFSAPLLLKHQFLSLVYYEMKRFFVFFLLILGLQGYQDAQLSWDLEDILHIVVDPDANRNVSQLISSKGYPVEDYDVQTEDGYILSMQRIPHGLKKTPYKKGVVFLQHGLLASSCDWVLNFPNESLGFLLADKGYDVWLGNIRGNTYSRRHISLKPDMKKFWEFSFDEMGKYDLPAMIDFVLKKTSQQQLYYIGHSQGTTAAFAMLSENPEYDKKLKIMIGLAPVATVGYITSALRYLVPFTYDVQLMFKLLGVNEFLPNNTIMKYLSEFVCDTRIKVLCSDVIFLLCGEDMAQLNMTRLHVYISHTPAGASTQSIIHFAQMVRSKTFQKFDFGQKGNVAHYNQTTPPEYHLEKITAPIALISSKNDKLADPVDVGLLQEKLQSLVSSTSVRDPLFNHIDFVWGIDAAYFVYEEIFTLLERYSF